MLKNYIKIAFRNLRKNKAFSLINITGLAVGMACCLMILLYVQFELSYDKFHENGNNIYRVIKEVLTYETKESRFSEGVPIPLGLAIKEDFPEIVNSVRFLFRTNSIIYNDKEFQVDNLSFADAGVFEMFTFPIIKGDPKTAVKEPNTAVIDQDLAVKLFNTDDPIGRIVQLKGRTSNIDIKITGLMKNIPNNSLFKTQMILSSLTHRSFRQLRNHWENNFSEVYIQLPDNFPKEQLENKFPLFVNKHFNKNETYGMKLHLQPFERIHLYSNKDYGFSSGGNINTVFIYAGIAFFVLIIGCINFINLSIGMSGRRFTEIGLRKVMGAKKSQIVTQFWGEVTFICLFAVILGIILTELFFPTFNILVNRNINLTYDINTVLTISGIILTSCFLAGVFPSFVFSRFDSVEIMRGRLKVGGSNILTKSLVVVQFVLSIGFIMCTSVVSDQLSFIMKSHKKVKDARIIGVDIRTTIKNFNNKQERNTAANKSIIYQEEVSKNHNVLNSTISSSYFGFSGGISGTKIEANNLEKYVTTKQIDYGFFDTFGLELAEGRNFSKEITADAEESILINESLARDIGWENAVGKKITFWKKEHSIIGVVKDYANAYVYYEIQPTIYTLESLLTSHVFFKVNNEDISGVIAFMEEKWNEIFPGNVFNYSFLDENLRRSYSKEIKSRKMFGIVSALAIIISCFGILGLTALTVVRRTKEIGIRKVFGASVTRIIRMLTKEFILLVILSTILASPAAYYFMNRWLQNFQYHTDITVTIFIISGLLALFIAIITVGFQAVKAAASNPVDTLRHE